MHELMDVNLQDKLGFTCDIPEKNDGDVESQDLLTKIVVDKNDCVMYAFVYGDINDVDSLVFEYSDTSVLTEWEQWQFELWVERNIEILAYNWQNSDYPAMFFTDLL